MIALMLQIIGRLPYGFALLLLRLGSHLGIGRKLRVWPRNSYLTKAFHPGKSDLDLSFLWETDPSPKEVTLWSRYQSLAKSCFPPFGETNGYSRSDWSLLEGIINPYELARDPTLKLLNPRMSGEKNAGAAIVWLMRLFDADFKNLNEAPTLRSRKWDLHLQEVGAAGRWDRSIQGLLTIISQLGSDPKLDLNKYYSWLAQREAEALPPYLQVERPDFPQEMYLLLPHRYCFSKPLVPELPAYSIFWEIFTQQIQWEIFGAYTQFRSLKSKDVLNKHLENLLLWTEACCVRAPSLSRLQRPLKELRSIVART